MYKYGAGIRMKCKYAKEAAMLLARMEREGGDEDSAPEAKENGDEPLSYA